MDIQKELKAIERQEAELSRKKRLLEKRREKLRALDGQLDKLMRGSDFSNPKELVEALVEKYNIRLTGVKKSGSISMRRKRTRITADLRDSIKRDVASGVSMNATSKKYNLSYIVVSKIVKGAYDELN